MLPRYLLSTFGQHRKPRPSCGGTSKGSATRNDIHSSVRQPSQAVQSGTRSDCEIVVYVDLEMAAKDGIGFYRSKMALSSAQGAKMQNGKGIIEPKYFLGIWDIKTE